MKKFIIEKHSHGFHVHVPYVTHRPMLYFYCKELTNYVWKWDRRKRKNVQVAGTTYAVVNADRDTFGFLINEYDAFMNYLKVRGVRDEEIEIRTVEPARGVKTPFLMPGIEPRDETQIKAMPYMLAPGVRIRLLPLPTGQGKTLTTMMALMRDAHRTAFVMGSRHIGTWLDTFLEYTDVDKKKIMVVKGSKAFQSMINLAKNGALQSTFIVISTDTMEDYVKFWTDGPDASNGHYDVPPQDLYRLLGVDKEVTDECHENLRQVVRRAILLDVHQRIYLSATLKKKCPVIMKTFRNAFDIPNAFKDFKNNDHIVAYPMYYRLQKPDKAKYMGTQGYSHNEYEKYLMKHPKLLEAYMEMTYKVFVDDYLENRKQGTRGLIFCSMKETCTKMVEYFKKRLPEDVSVGRFIGEDDDSVLKQFEVIISTPKSCGTGRDIPNLMVTVNTVAIGDESLVEQVMGRLRVMKLYKDESPRYYYLCCASIEKHMMYDEAHQHNLRNKTADVRPQQTSFFI